MPEGKPAREPLDPTEQRANELLEEHGHNPYSLALALAKKEEKLEEVQGQGFFDILCSDLLSEWGLKKAVAAIEAKQTRWECAGEEKKKEMVEPKGVVVFLDADNLYHFNEVGQEMGKGQEEGDEFLAAIASAIKETLGRRETDVIARKHGDEFVVILRGMSKEAAIDQVREFNRTLKQLSEAYREELAVELEQMGIGEKDRQEIVASCRFSASAALAEWGKTRRVSEAITAADSAVLEAKKQKKQETGKKRGGHVGFVVI